MDSLVISVVNDACGYNLRVALAFAHWLRGCGFNKVEVVIDGEEETPPLLYVKAA